MNDILLSFRDVEIRTPEEGVFPAISLEIKTGEQLVLTGENEPYRNALLYALAGKTGIARGTVSHHFYKDLLAVNPVNDPLFSPYKLIALVGPRHSFRNLSNTTELYYQQRYNALDAENSMTVAAYLSSIKAVVPAPVWTPERVIEELHLRPHLEKRVIQLSNGETKRVLIAAAILRNPVLLLLDNPLIGLDTGARTEIKELIDHLSMSGITIILNMAADELPARASGILLFEADNSVSRLPVKEFREREERRKKHIGDTTGDADGNKNEGTASLPYREELPEAAASLLLAGYKRDDSYSSGGHPKADSYTYIVKMKNVSVRYGDKIILEAVNWTVRQGERWALLGHNGAGKTTLLSLVNGDNPQAYANDIVLFDRKRGTGESIWDIKSRIGFVSAELYQYFPIETSCLNAVESGFYDTTGLFRKSIPGNRQTALQWMQMLGVADLAGKLLKNVSPINQRLCLLARALVKSPPLLILDEPCQGFDKEHQLRFRRLLDMLCTSGNLTLIYVTHYVEELPGSVNRFLRLERGRVVSVK